MQHSILCLSSLGAFLPILVYIFYREYSHMYTFFSIMILSNIIASIFFWKDAIKNGVSHKIDGILARIIFICSLGYILIYKTMSPFTWFLFGMILGKIGFYIYLSNEYSSREWCSTEHIYHHLFFHLSIPFALLFCFI
jgi:hypothetical protein